MTKLPSLQELLEAGVHFGHQRSRWHPKMKPYIFGARGGVQIINLEKTLEELEKTLAFVKRLAGEGGTILFVGTKRQAREIIKSAAEKCSMPYLVERWIGGMLTNFPEVKRRLKKYHSLKDQIASGELQKYTKKEQLDIEKDIVKMDKYLSGINKLEKIPEALFIADMRTEKTAIAEAHKTNVTIVGVCDTNVNPLEADYIIPANDDAVNSIKIIVELVGEAIAEGRAEFEKHKATAIAGQAAAAAEAIKAEKDQRGSIPAASEEKPVKKERRAMRKEESL